MGATSAETQAVAADGLTADEMTVLIDALDSWINKDAGGEMFGDMMGALLFGGKTMAPEAKEKYEADVAKRRASSESARELRKEQATILKAKLMQSRRSLRISQEHEASA